jgi:hypothetical protein
MCIGELSSSIRKNRERLPAIKNAYDDNFIEQLEEFIPHLNELRFNGGEPFLINAVFKIFEKVEKLNPKLKIVIATNGTVMNYKVKEWLSKLNIHINFSLDSLTPEIYETIRVNAHFDRVMEHFLFYHQYTKENKRTMCLMVNPMRNNWHEMPEFIRFVNKHNINIWFNTIQRPEEWSLWALPYEKLQEVYQTLSAVEFTKAEKNHSLSPFNLSIYKNLVNVQIKNWLNEAKETDSRAIATTDETSRELSEAETKEMFTKKLRDYIFSNGAATEEQKAHRDQLLFEKMNRIEALLKERNSTVEFYKVISHAPADIFYKEMESRSVNSLVEDFENRFMQHV